MIWSPFTGNLSDNLKSYLITRIVADKKGYEFGFNRHPEFDYYGGQPQLDFFDIDYGSEHSYKYADVPEFVTNIWDEKRTSTQKIGNDNVDFYDYQPDIFDIPDNTKIIVKCLQDIRYYQDYKDKIQSWINVKEEIQYETIKILFDNDIILNDDVCICSIRGGEFRSVPNLILAKKYWEDAKNKMIEHNPNMRFYLVSEDPQYSASLFDNQFPVIHISPAADWFILNSAKNLILSNSGFGIFPTWLNKNNPYTIAPWGWARYNIGMWCPASLWLYPWNFMNRDGEFKKVEEENES